MEKIVLENLYSKKGKSVRDIASLYRCSENKINYWLKIHKIKKRTISEAIYSKHNPKGDPFKLVNPRTVADFFLFGLGLGLYWGEGNKANKNTVRLGNSDPRLLEFFIRFLERFYSVKRSDLKFHLQLFTDISIDEAARYWMKNLKIKPKQFYKPTITQSGRLGTYKKKSENGVLTVYYSNVKLRNIIVGLLSDIGKYS